MIEVKNRPMKYPSFTPRLRKAFINPYVMLGAFALGSPLAACGGYAADPTPASGGASASGGDANAASGGDANTASGGDSNMGSGGMQPAPEPSCENVAACGGEIAQGWFAQDMYSCLEVSGAVDLSLAGIGCLEGTVTEGSYTVTGNFSVNSDMTISDNTSTTLKLTMELPPECKDVSNTLVPCEGLEASLTAGAGFDSILCVDSVVTDDWCTCTVDTETSGGMSYPLGNYTAKTAGTYTVEGNKLIVEGTSDDPSLPKLEYEFCVDGEYAKVTPITPTSWGVAKGTIVLQFQP